MIHRDWHWRSIGCCIVLSILGAVSIGCDDSPKTALADGRQALVSGDLERAAEQFEQAAHENPELLEARRLLAKTHMEAREYERARQILEQLWTEEGFERESELSAGQRSMRQLMNDQFRQLYHQWIESIDSSDDPEEFERIGRMGLERYGRDDVLNARMVDFYKERAERHIERNERIEAAEKLERIDELHEFPDTRREYTERARRLRRQAFGEQARQRFERDLRPDLVEAGSYDADGETVLLDVEQPVDRRLDPDDHEALEQARKTAIQTLLPTLSQFAVSLGAAGRDEIEMSALELPELAITDEDFQPGRYEMVVALKLSALVDMAFDYAEYRRTGQPAEAGVGGGDDFATVAIDDKEIKLDTTDVDDQPE